MARNRKSRLFVFCGLSGFFTGHCKLRILEENGGELEKISGEFIKKIGLDGKICVKISFLYDLTALQLVQLVQTLFIADPIDLEDVCIVMSWYHLTLEPYLP